MNWLKNFLTRAGGMKYGRNIDVSSTGDGRAILNAANMSARPGYYSGRGATRSDLSGERLCAIYHSVAEHHGIDAGLAFLALVNNLKVLSATDFILAFYQLERSDWEGVTRFEGNGTHISAPCDTEEGQLQGKMTLFAALASNGRDDSSSIRFDFRAWMQKLRVVHPELVPDSAIEAVSPKKNTGSQDFYSYW